MSAETKGEQMEDVETEALVTVSRALAVLDRHQCARVLRWAEERYAQPPRELDLEDLNVLNRWNEGILELARGLRVKPMDLIAAMTAVVDEHERIKASSAPEEVS